MSQVRYYDLINDFNVTGQSTYLPGYYNISKERGRERKGSACQLGSYFPGKQSHLKGREGGRGDILSIRTIFSWEIITSQKEGGAERERGERRRSGIYWEKRLVTRR